MNRANGILVAKAGASSHDSFLPALLYFLTDDRPLQFYPDYRIERYHHAENLGAKAPHSYSLLIALFAVEAMIFYVHVARDIAPSILRILTSCLII